MDRIRYDLLARATFPQNQHWQICDGKPIYGVSESRDGGTRANDLHLTGDLFRKLIAAAILGSEREVETTRQLRRIIESALPQQLDDDAKKATVTRVFQAIRIAVNGEFTAIDAFLNQLPHCLRPGGRAAILSFHSGEDRRVKHHFRDGFRSGIYAEIATEVVRPTPAEIGGNPRADHSAPSRSVASVPQNWMMWTT